MSWCNKNDKYFAKITPGIQNSSNSTELKHNRNCKHAGGNYTTATAIWSQLPTPATT